MKMKLLAILVILVIGAIPAQSQEDNSTEIAELQELLDSNHFIYAPELDVFDCVDMSTANYRFLESKGYEALIAIREDGFMPDGKPTGHCFAIVKLSNGWVGVETKQAVTNTTRSIGTVIEIPVLREICKTPEEVYQKDRRGSPVITGEVITKNN
jgi:hypothetical protein